MTSGVHRYQVCLFDLYDTLVHFDKATHFDHLETMAALCSVSVRAFRRAWNGLAVRSNLGEFPTTSGRAAAVLAALGRPAEPEVVGQLAAEEHKYRRTKAIVFDDVFGTLGRLRGVNVRIGIVSNASPSVRETLAGTSLDTMVDSVMLSCDCGIRKPAPGIYLKALEQLAAAEAATVFVGDGNDSELDGAKQLGLSTVRIRRAMFMPIIGQSSDDRMVDATIDSLSELTPLFGW